jgi:hypothetical protein
MIATSSNQKLRGVSIKMMVKGGVFLEKKNVLMQASI